MATASLISSSVKELMVLHSVIHTKSDGIVVWRMWKDNFREKLKSCLLSHPRISGQWLLEWLLDCQFGKVPNIVWGSSHNSNIDEVQGEWFSDTVRQALCLKHDEALTPTGNLESPVHLTCMFRKAGHPQETCADTGKHYTERSQPGSSWLVDLDPGHCCCEATMQTTCVISNNCWRRNLQFRTTCQKIRGGVGML